MNYKHRIPEEGVSLKAVVDEHIEALKKAGDLPKDAEIIAGAVNVEEQKILIILNDGIVIEINIVGSDGVRLVQVKPIPSEDSPDCGNGPLH